MNKFITIEGIEGAGKSTTLSYVKSMLENLNIDFVLTREPGGTKLAEGIRDVLLNPANETMQPETELLLMFAARAQHIAEIIKPNLDAGKCVISDRFTDATYAYQGGGRNMPFERIAKIENWVQGNLQPDLTLLLDISPEAGMARIGNRDKDRFEQEDLHFFTRVRNAYLKRAEQDPKRFVIINADQSLEHVQADVEQALSNFFKS